MVHHISDKQKLLADFAAGDDELAEAAAQQIAALGDEALPTLETVLAQGDVDARWWAARTLALITAPEAGAMLINTLADEDLSVRQCAVLGLRTHPSADALPALSAALHAEDQLLRRLAADAFTAMGAEAIPALAEVMQNGPQTARLEAVRALAKIEHPDATPILFSYLEDDSALIRHWAEEGLERLGVGMVFFDPQ